MYTTQAVVEADRTLDNLTIANEKLRVDIEKWTDAKDQEVSDLCCTFADNHIDYHQKVEKLLQPLCSPYSNLAKCGLQSGTDGLDIFRKVPAKFGPKICLHFEVQCCSSFAVLQ